MANTLNYGWPLPYPRGIQITEIAKVAGALSAIDGTFKSFEQAYSSHTHRFDDLAGKPTTLKGYGIADGMTAAEIAAAIRAATSGLLNGAGAALDTLKELGDALGNNPNLAADVSAALGLRVRVDAAQSLPASQKAQARANIDAVGTADKGVAGGIATLGSNGLIPNSQLPTLTTTATVGTALAGASGIAVPADGDRFAGVLAGASTVFHMTWGNIKAALGALFVKKTGDTMTGPLINTSGSIIIQSNANAHYWFRNADGTERAVIWSEANTLNLNLRTNGKVSSFRANGDFVTSGWVYSGAACMSSDGNIYGTAWGGGWLSDWIETRAKALAQQEAIYYATYYANDRVANLQYRKVSEGSLPTQNVQRAPAGAVLTGFQATGGSPPEETLLFYFHYLQVYDPVRGWVTFQG